jgi:hypothetical protein
MNNLTGFLLTVAAGACVGFSVWPLKWARTWKWENFWLFSSLFSLIIFPTGLAFVALPHLATVYASLTLGDILLPLLLGFLWGFRTAWGRSLCSASRPGGHDRCSGCGRRGVRHDHSPVVVAS